MRVLAPTQPADLAARLNRARRVLAWCVTAAGLLLVATLFLLEPGSTGGPRDVHLPDAGYLASHQATGGPIPDFHIVGAGIARLQHMLARLVNFGSVAAFGTLLFSLVKRRKSLGRYAIASIVLMGVVRPVSPPVQGAPPQAVGAAAARSLLGLRAGEPLEHAVRAEPRAAEPDDVRDYIAAQIAFIEGDRNAAARLARGIDPGRLASPIEAPFRLQFLRGDYRGLTSVCFASGCLLEHQRRLWIGGAAVAGAAALVAALASACLFVSLRRRLHRIDELRASGRRRELGFA